MWADLPQNQKDKYKKIITNFASLSESFAQKANEDDIISPVINSKFQEKAFQDSFNATVEDIHNTSYDASILTKDHRKYLVGIKAFGINSGDQKIAQFKSSSRKWENILNQIEVNAKGLKTTEEIDKANNQLYLQLAKKISTIRNERIKSSRAQLVGFKDSPDIESVYHVLMPSPKGAKPQITVGETSYLSIDVDNIKIIGTTGKRTPNNFKFTDNQHEYKYTSSDSQLLMNFQNKDIQLESWDIHYIQDATNFFERLNEIHKYSQPSFESYSWIIYDKNGKIHPYSAFNAFNGQSHIGRKNNAREKKIQNIDDKYRASIGDENMDYVVKELKNILLNYWKTNDEKEKLSEIRSDLISNIKKFGSKDFIEEIENTIYRPAHEVYIPIPNSKKFHEAHPNFFNKNVGKFKTDSPNKFVLPKEERTFTLRFMPSGEKMIAYVNQDSGKAIQSYCQQTIMGEWLIDHVFQLKNREVLTKDKLDELGINGIRLTKNTTDNCIDLRFIYIDPDNPPKDAIGWVSNKKE